MFEWEGLPKSVDPRYLEMSIHEFGYVGFYKDPKIGYLAVQGTVSGTMNHYNLPTHFHAVAPQYQNTFPIYNFSDMQDDHQGIVIWNNDYHWSTLPSLKMFAIDLAELKNVIYVNQNAQKTPWIIVGNSNNLLTTKNVYNQIEEGGLAIFLDDSFDPNSIDVLQTNAPYVVDKLNDQKNAVWSEVMTYLGIKNSNIDKKERLITDEVNSNDEQIESSSNIFLKARQEACEKMNELYGLNVSVKIRHDIQDELMQNFTPSTSNNEGDT
jgi:hypothetical protein